MLSMIRLRIKKIDLERKLITEVRSSTVILRKCSINGKRKSQRKETNLLEKRLSRHQKWWRNLGLNGFHFKIELQRYIEIASTSKKTSHSSHIMINLRMSYKNKNNLGDYLMSLQRSLMNSEKRNGWHSERKGTLHSKIYSCNGQKSLRAKTRMW